MTRSDDRDAGRGLARATVTASILAIALLGACQSEMSKRDGERQQVEAEMLQSDIDSQAEELKKLTEAKRQLSQEVEAVRDERAAQRAREKLAEKVMEIEAKERALQQLQDIANGKPPRSTPRGKPSSTRIKCDPNDPLCG